MAYGKLKMKAVPGEAPIDDSQPRKRRRRHPTRSPSVDPPTPPYPHASTSTSHLDVDESARPPPSRPSYIRDDPIGAKTEREKQRERQEEEELVINWTTTSPTLAARLLTLPTDSAFRAKIFSALEDDEPLDALEARYGFTVPSRWREGGHDYASGGMGKSGVEGMEDEEYCEYVRRNMWRRTHREEVLALEAKEKEAKRKERELKEARRKREEEKRERERKDKERRARNEERDKRKARESYADKWAALNDPARSSDPLRFSDVPWPIYPPSSSALDTSLFATSTISTFLLSHLPSAINSSDRKDALRLAIRTYHPDRFHRHLLRLREETGERTKAREMGLRVSQVLNELNEEEAKGKAKGT